MTNLKCSEGPVGCQGTWSCPLFTPHSEWLLSEVLNCVTGWEKNCWTFPGLYCDLSDARRLFSILVPFLLWASCENLKTSEGIKKEGTETRLAGIFTWRMVEVLFVWCSLWRFVRETLGAFFLIEVASLFFFHKQKLTLELTLGVCCSSRCGWQ